MIVKQKRKVLRGEMREKGEMVGFYLGCHLSGGWCYLQKHHHQQQNECTYLVNATEIKKCGEFGSDIKR